MCCEKCAYSFIVPTGQTRKICAITACFAWVSPHLPEYPSPLPDAPLSSDPPPPPPNPPTAPGARPQEESLLRDITNPTGTMEENKKNLIFTRSLSNLVQDTIRTTFDTIVWFSKRTGFRFRTGERTDSLDTTLFRLPLFALPFSQTSSGRHFAAFPVAIKTPRNYVNCALVYEIIPFGMISKLISRIMRAPSLFYSVYLWEFSATLHYRKYVG